MRTWAVETWITIEEAQRRWFELLDEVSAGASFVLVDRASPVARLVSGDDQGMEIDALLQYVEALPRRTLIGAWR